MRLGFLTKSFSIGAFALLVAWGSSLTSPSIAKAEGEISEKPLQLAQLKLEFGGNERDVIRSLRREGYSEIQVVSSGFSKLRVQACYQGSRYDVKVKRFTGKVTRVGKIGECRPPLEEAQILRRLRREGYRRISIYSSEADLFKLVACQRGRRFRMEINIYGDVLRRDEVGSCEKTYNIAEIRQRLRDQGFNRLKLVRERDRAYVFEGCQRRNQVRLRVRKNGVIARRRVIGKCTPPLSFKQIPSVMERLGFDRVVMVDRKLPVYIAEGCSSSSTRVQVKFNRFGDELDRDNVGECEPPLTKDDVQKLIREGGANRIFVEVDARGNFVATSCHRLKKFRSRFDRYGKLFEQRVIGKCSPAPRLNQIVEKFRVRDGVEAVEIFVEGCRRNGRRMRFTIDEFGDVLASERIGRCR